jgi:hypothetical protein
MDKGGNGINGGETNTPLVFAMNEANSTTLPRVMTRRRMLRYTKVALALTGGRKWHGQEGGMAAKSSNDIF